jgi:hypothetical protein
VTSWSQQQRNFVLAFLVPCGWAAHLTVTSDKETAIIAIMQTATASRRGTMIVGEALRICI